MGKAERLIIYTLLAVLVVATFTDLGPIHAKDKPGEATFSKVTIVDEEGRARIELGERTTEKGDHRYFGLRILDEKGQEGVLLNMLPSGTGLLLRDGNGKIRVGLISMNFETSLRLYSENHRSHLKPNSLKIKKINSEPGSVSMYIDSSGLLIMSRRIATILSASELFLYGSSSTIQILDDQDKVRTILGSALLVETETGTEIKRSPASLVFFDKEGEKVIWEAP